MELNLARHNAWFNASLPTEDISAFEYDDLQLRPFGTAGPA